MGELELLIDLHKDADRQGPGSEKDTLKALSFINVDTNSSLKILDIGCGTGAQTITLAQNLRCDLVAVDLFEDFLDKLNDKAKKLNFDNIRTLKCSMDELSFENIEFDIIWSEGAIYNIGFENGIKSWSKFLKKGGYIGLSEITWTTNSRPEQVQQHWDSEYNEIDTASNKIKVLEENGFKLVGYFILPQESWLENYYRPMEKRFKSFLERNNYSEIAKSIVENEKKEIELYKKYKDFYSYGFYIAKKN